VGDDLLSPIGRYEVHRMTASCRHDAATESALLRCRNNADCSDVVVVPT
jgi:hypothetical protein